MILKKLKLVRWALCLFMCCICAQNAFAIPAWPAARRLKLENGKHVRATLKGDEFGHWYETDDGDFLQLTPTDRAKVLTQQEVMDLKASRKRKMLEANAPRQNNRLVQSRQAASAGFTGKKKGLVILVNFSNKQISCSSSEFSNMFNKVGYTNNGHIGSVHDYFSDNSYGQFNLTFDVVGPVTVSRTVEYYGANSSSGSDSHPAAMVIEACKLADNSVNFGSYDWDGDGYVDQVFVIYAGYGENWGASSNVIWPHKWCLEQAYYCNDGTGILTLDGKKINAYACTSELAGASGSRLAGIGTAVHEFSHCLGLPDTYDTDYSGGTGMMEWDIMCSGSYNGPNGLGERPAGYTAYEKWFEGWITPNELSSSCYIENMPALSSNSNAAYVIYNSSKRTEFYMLENRQQGKWDYLYSGKYLGHGLLITHVDYSASAWSNNTVNNDPNHQRMIFFPADGGFNSSPSGYAGDTYPGTWHKTELTDNSSPSATVFNGSKMGKPITDITENGGYISFSFMGGKKSSGGGDDEQAGGEPTAVSIPYSLSVHIGGSEQIVPTLVPASASTTFTWTSSNTAVATVSNGYVRGISSGTAVISCTTAGGIKSNSCTVTVTSLSSNSISIIPSYLYLPIGQSKQMGYSLTPWNASVSISWSITSGNDVVSITSDGLVTALAAGYADIKVMTSDGNSDIGTICVPPNPESITLPAALSIGLGESRTMTPTVTPGNAYYEGYWSSSNPNTVSVSTTGKITARSLGTATLTLTTSKGLTASTLVTVHNPSYYFLILLHNASTLRYEIEECPVLTVRDNDLVFTTANGEQSYSKESVWKMLLIDQDDISRIGDINEDGQVDIADVAMLIQVWKDRKQTDIDLNFDGVLDFKDLELLKQKILDEDN